MAIGITKPTSQVGDTANVAVYSMAPSFLPAADSKLVVIQNASATITGSVSGAGGLTWFTVASINAQASGFASRMFAADVSGNPSSVSINNDFTGDNATGCCAVALQVTGCEHYIRQVVQVQSVGANPQITFPLPVDTNNGYIAAVMMTAGIGAFVAPAGWTTVVATYGTPANALGVAFRAGGETASTFTFSCAGTGLAAFAVEIWANGAIPSLDPVGVSGVFGY